MSPRKLTEDDKQEILQLYRNSEATTSTLATRYEVSSSTISRFLKNKLTQSEYEDLIQQKRLARTPRREKAKPASTSKAKSAKKTKSKTTTAKSKPKTAPAETAETIVAIEPTETTTSTRRRRRRSTTAKETPTTLTETPSVDTPELETIAETPEPSPEAEPVVLKASDRPILKKDKVEEIEPEIDRVDVMTLEAMLGEDIDDEDIDDEDDEDEWELEETEEDIAYPHADRDFDIQIMPLSTASLPRTCYLVIDRSAELIVKPLRDFADLGSIPETEIKQKTLPVFDNHRIAKRFSHRRERVIKVPDSRILHKTSHYLEAKGITRLLVDGKIYSLSSEV